MCHPHTVSSTGWGKRVCGVKESILWIPLWMRFSFLLFFFGGRGTACRVGIEETRVSQPVLSGEGGFPPLPTHQFVRKLLTQKLLVRFLVHSQVAAVIYSTERPSPIVMHIPAFIFMDDNPSYANGDNPGIVIQTKLAYVGRTVNNARIQKEVERRSTEPHRHITPGAVKCFARPTIYLWASVALVFERR